ncbi:MAG: hypothetical protein IPJ04_02530 [Candidatus Eisenbacteria bacterium]|nr:hypothetical protein [Candidatus Eisenbacteria bacterium]
MSRSARVRSLAAHALLGALVAATALAPPARAVMDIEDRGPVLHAGRFSLRVSNVGVLGNPWFAIGRSFDPSWEYPSGSGHELLGHAELWVGGLTESGERRVSGGPILEWRPTLAPDDRVRRTVAGASGGRWNVDDDGDGRVDEETVNGRDDDGDGLVDEDFDMPAQEMLTAEYTDDTREAIEYGYDGGEQHVPLGLSVHQEAFTWSRPGLDGIACVRFVITNHSTHTVRDLRLGLYADLDSRGRNEGSGHLDDAIARVEYERVVPKPESVINAAGLWRKPCFERTRGVAVAASPLPGQEGVPIGAIVPLSHTTDPLATFTNDVFPGVREARAAARAPASDTTFHVYAFSPGLPPGQGGPPTLDRDRWSALEGLWPGLRDETHRQDVSTLIACGPFARLAPGQSVEFSVAFVAASTRDSLTALALTARDLQRGTRFNLRPDTTIGRAWFAGSTGVNGHEAYYEPPEGVVFSYDPHCPQKIYSDYTPDPRSQGPPVSFEVEYRHGKPVWTDLDCDGCTGDDGVDGTRPWYLISLLPPPPAQRATAGDARVRIEWDDSPEAVLASGRVGDSGLRFAGYKLYRLSDWRRDGLLPPPERWQPFVDSTVHDGFDYSYVVTSFLRAHAPYDTLPGYVAELESSFEPDFDRRVVPHVAAGARGGDVWVAPNPYRASAPWDRPAVPGDVFTKHVDFLRLPRERCTIRVYTLAGDFVAEVPHDGGSGDGQASWNLVTRNGQDAASGVYLFVMDSASRHQVGRFVILR